MYICYLDESGTPQIGANTSHFVLLGLAIPDIKWKEYDRQILERKTAFQLSGVEIHTAWLLRDYPEQKRISEFGRLGHEDRKKAILSIRAFNLARSRTQRQQRELLKNYKHTSDYAHLTIEERKAFLNSIADTINSWKDAALFAEAQDKAKAQPVNAFDVAFEQVVTRFNTFPGARGQAMGMTVQDNNQTVSSLLTANMRRYHKEGTIWSKIDRIKNRFDRSGDRMVGIRHYTGRVKCSGEICKEHGRVW